MMAGGRQARVREGKNSMEDGECKRGGPLHI